MNGLIIADDLTGALDTAVQFCGAGFSPAVLNSLDHEDKIVSDHDIIVINAESRHMTAADAYKKVSNMLMQTLRKHSFDWYLKKTDSALRGNIGSELKAFSDVLHPAAVDFLPASHQAGRTTKNGVQLIHNIPVAKTAFHDDPFNPVCISEVAEIIKRLATLKSCTISVNEKIPASDIETVYIYDAVTNEDLMTRYAQLRLIPGRNVYAGCAGLAQVIARTEKSSKKKEESHRIQCSSPLVLCGSLNAASKAQLAFAEQAGIKRLTLSYDRIRDSLLIDSIINHIDNGPLLIDTDDHIDNTVPVLEAGRNMAKRLGCLCRQLSEAKPDTVIFVIGGDTLSETLHAMDDPVLIPIGELRQGTVAFIVRQSQGDRILISRSGGFGSSDCIFSLIRDIQEGVRI